MSLNVEVENCPYGTDRTRIIQYTSVVDKKTEMTILKLKFGFTLPRNGELKSLHEQVEWIAKELIVTPEDDEGIDFDELNKVADELLLKEKRNSLSETEAVALNQIREYTICQERLTDGIRNGADEAFGIIINETNASISRTSRARLFTNKELLGLLDLSIEGLTKALAPQADFLANRFELATQVRLFLNNRKQTPEPPKKEKEAKPSKQSQTRSANKARDQKKREQEEYLRRVAEAEKAKAEEERKRRAKKTAKK